MPDETSPYPLPSASPAAPADGARSACARPSKLGNLVGIGVCALALGLLIWAKLQLVAGVPRTAVAEPEQQGQAAQAVTGTANDPSDRGAAPGR
jgi:hypothetical protein